MPLAILIKNYNKYNLVNEKKLTLNYHYIYKCIMLIIFTLILWSINNSKEKLKENFVQSWYSPQKSYEDHMIDLELSLYSFIFRYAF